MASMVPCIDKLRIKLILSVRSKNIKDERIPTAVLKWNQNNIIEQWLGQRRIALSFVVRVCARVNKEQSYGIDFLRYTCLAKCELPLSQLHPVLTCLYTIKWRRKRRKKCRLFKFEVSNLTRLPWKASIWRGLRWQRSICKSEKQDGCCHQVCRPIWNDTWWFVRECASRSCIRLAVSPLTLEMCKIYVAQ